MNNFNRPPVTAEDQEAWLTHLIDEARNVFGEHDFLVAWTVARAIVTTGWGRTLGDGTNNVLGLEPNVGEPGAAVEREFWIEAIEQFETRRLVLRTFACVRQCFEAWRDMLDEEFGPETICAEAIPNVKFRFAGTSGSQKAEIKALTERIGIYLENNDRNCPVDRQALAD